MQWLVTIIVGGIVGWLGSLLAKTNAQMGILANVIVGIIGSSLGFWLAGVIGIAPDATILRWCVAVVGAVILIAILKVLGIFK
jgi:uncharacterized membrane protein YeaQ/YmgE (transglycosylase-associated protein family)